MNWIIDSMKTKKKLQNRKSRILHLGNKRVNIVSIKAKMSFIIKGSDLFLKGYITDFCYNMHNNINWRSPVIFLVIEGSNPFHKVYFADSSYNIHNNGWILYIIPYVFFFFFLICCQTFFYFRQNLKATCMNFY